MQIGSPFNPYKVFQGIFAPYWLLEHPGIGAGAKLCYIRLLGFAGKDARCYPSLETLGKRLGVSERQARDYVKELERTGLIAVEHRGLRKTNVYLFLWTAELDALCNSVPDIPDDPDEGPETLNGPQSGPSSSSGLDRNSCSAQDRNHSSALDRNTCSGLDRNSPSGPIGINSIGINSSESSSAPQVSRATPKGARRKTTSSAEQIAVVKPEHLTGPTNRIAAAIVDWAKKRNIQRLRSDRQVGLPERERLAEWVAMFEVRGILEDEQVFCVLDAARAAADRSAQWRNWAFLTLQIQLSAERLECRNPSGIEPPTCLVPPAEDPESIWARAKTRIRSQIPEIAFLNWYACTRQIMTSGSRVDVAVPDEATGAYLTSEYHDVTRTALLDLGVNEIRFIVCDPP